MTKTPKQTLWSSSDSFQSTNDSSNELARTKEALRQSIDVTEQLRSSLSTLVLEKQALTGQMQQCQASNDRLVQELAMEHADFEERTMRMQHEISVIRSNVVDAKTDLVLANSDMRENLTSAARTTMRLSLMYLRMRQAKQRAENRSQYHTELFKDFEASIQEQAKIIMQMRRPTDDESESKQILFDAQQRISDLLQQNASLHIRLNAEQIRKHSSRQTRLVTRRLLRRLAKELCYESGMPDPSGRRAVVFGRRRIPRQLHAHLVADTDVTIYDAEMQ